MRQYFIPSHLRASFEEHLDGERIRSAREVCVLASVLYVLFGVLDTWAIPSALREVWTVRAAVVLVIMGFLWTTRFPFFLKHYAPLTIGMFLVMGSGIEIMVYLAGPDDLAKHLYYTGMILVVMGLYTWSFLPIWKNAATGLVLVALYILISVLIQDMGSEREWPVLLTNCFFFVSANVIGMFANAQRNRYLRESFLLRQNLISDLQRTEAEKQQSVYWSEHDPLTGLPNRKHLMLGLEKAIQTAKESATTLALLFIDLDGFKSINDKFGHAVGDAVLRVIGQRLEHCVRENDLFARIGGDEFVVVMNLDPRFHEVATRLAGSIIASIEAPIREPDIGVVLSASIGIAFFPDHASDAEKLLLVADAQMYESKRRGKGTMSVTSGRIMR
jgi:diguanylate cyclase (GGDEF)-like protein